MLRCSAQDVISEREDSTPPEQSTPAEAVEGFIRQTKIIDFLKFHDTAKLDAKCWREGAEVCEPTRRFGILASANVRSEPATPPSASRRRPKPIGQFEVDGFSDSGGALRVSSNPRQRADVSPQSALRRVTDATSTAALDCRGVWVLCC